MSGAPVGPVTRSQVVQALTHSDPEAARFYVGLDIGRTHPSLCVLGATGQVARRAQVRGIDPLPRAGVDRVERRR